MLLNTPGIRIAQVLEDQVLPVSDPNDRYYDQWKYLGHDAQWHLHNRGTRSGPQPTCTPGPAGQDIDAERAWSYLGSYGDPTVTVGLLDTGIFGGNADTLGHQDIPVIPLTYAQRTSISKHPGIDWCFQADKKHHRPQRPE